MTARQLYEAGKLNEAIEALGAELREHPADVQLRTFLFELLCFAGNWDRADKQLDILAGEDKDRRLGALLYRAAIQAERTRQEMFQTGLPSNGADPGPVRGTLNGKEFQSLEDADPRIGGRLEVLAGGNYMWIPFAHIAKIEMQPPKRLRDLLWAPATVETGPAFGGSPLGEVLLPVLSPASHSHSDDTVRLGRATVWESDIPFGQKLLAVDNEEIPLLELRRLEIAQPEGQ
jgi:type VI secretion system protein ImpE